METERFCVPELLFSPGDIGIDQAGVAETAWQALQALHKQVAQRPPCFLFTYSLSNRCYC